MSLRAWTTTAPDGEAWIVVEDASRTNPETLSFTEEEARQLRNRLNATLSIIERDRKARGPARTGAADTSPR